ncbi:hypothetical protein NAP1_01565 [Erythrobacter sp. NAP1]|uniref:hypothetical protein n=1 Tax=Erythrobacter sp. NAP1 TaxID=237727 RepID=UPI0000686C14|nr:hypothetical protein [Erythrobacter sp. NAP1]EAQ29419.1 hypothetical protein NAP1_01565 [Erythrobacter sp. NAP1]
MRSPAASLIAVAAAAGLTASHPAAARDMHERHIETLWTISDVDLIESDSSAPADEEGRLVANDDFVIKQRLLPPTAARLTSAIVDGDGDVLAEAGDELFGVVSGSGDVYCLDKRPEYNPVGALMVGAIFQASCFKDADGDGTFDGGFKKKLQPSAFPQLRGKHRRNLREISGGSFEKIDPRALTKVYYVGIEFDGRGFLAIGKSRYFRVAFGGEYAKGELSRWFSTDGDELPKEMGAEGLGAKWTVLGFEDGAIRVRVDEPLEQKPFAVSIRVTIR